MDTEELVEDVEIVKGSEESDYCYPILSVETTGRSNLTTNIRTVLSHRVGKPDVCEVYSPPRIVDEAAKQGLRPGFSRPDR